MSVLYDAVMILGRSDTVIDRTGWLCGSLGHTDGPKCVNGVLTVASGSKDACYIYGAIAHNKEALRMAGATLVRTTPVSIEQLEATTSMRDDFQLPNSVYAVFESPEGCSLEHLGDTLALINDHYNSAADYEEGNPYLNEDSAREWFDRAFDLLAQQLPTPLPAPAVTFGAPGGAVPA
jgi:hypothetical protein